jgi:hypothetical protein
VHENIASSSLALQFVRGQVCHLRKGVRHGKRHHRAIQPMPNRNTLRRPKTQRFTVQKRVTGEDVLSPSDTNGHLGSSHRMSLALAPDGVRPASHLSDVAVLANPHPYVTANPRQPQPDHTGSSLAAIPVPLTPPAICPTNSTLHLLTVDGR